MLGTRPLQWHEHSEFRINLRQGNLTVKTLRLPALAATLTLAVALTACQPGEAPEGTETTAAADAGPDAMPGISGSDGRIVLPVVAGRPAAVYFTIRNDGPDMTSLVGVFVTGASKAEMHRTEGGSMKPVESVELAPGQQVQFAPGGYHAMAFGLGDALKPGGISELTLTFAGGDKLSMPLQIETMADEMDHDDMPGMDH